MKYHLEFDIVGGHTSAPLRNLSPPIIYVYKIWDIFLWFQHAYNVVCMIEHTGSIPEVVTYDFCVNIGFIDILTMKEPELQTDLSSWV